MISVLILDSKMAIRKFKVIAFRKGKKLGSLRDVKGRVMLFKSKISASTTARMEGSQMEGIGINFKVVPTIMKKKKRR